MEDEESSQSQEYDRDASSQGTTDDQTSESSTVTLVNLSCSFSEETFNEQKTPNPTQAPLPSNYDASGSSMGANLPAALDTEVLLCSTESLLAKPRSAKLYLDYASSTTSEEQGALHQSVSAYLGASLSTTSQESGTCIPLRGIPNVMDLTKNLEEINDSVTTGDSSRTDLENTDSLNLDHESMRFTDLAENSDDDTSVIEFPVLNSGAEDVASIEFCEAAAVNEVGDNTLRQFDPELDNLVNFTLSSLHNLFTSGDPQESSNGFLDSTPSTMSEDSGEPQESASGYLDGRPLTTSQEADPSSSTNVAATAGRRTHLLYKAVYDTNFNEYSLTLDPDLNNGDPANRLEDECLCNNCLVKIDDKVSTCLAYLFKVFRTKCPKCTYQDRMKEYQMICYSCSRIDNICFHCGKIPVLDSKDVLNFYSLFTEENNFEFFCNLRQEQKRHIIYLIYRKWDTVSSDQKHIIVKNLLDDVLKSLQLIPNLYSANPLI